MKNDTQIEEFFESKAGEKLLVSFIEGIYKLKIDVLKEAKTMICSFSDEEPTDIIDSMIKDSNHELELKIKEITN